MDKEIEKADIYGGEERCYLNLDIKLLNNRLLIIETEHKNCRRSNIYEHFNIQH